MHEDVELRCRCGKVRGILRGASPSTVHRIICYCGDCCAFARYLDRADLLDVRGGSDLVQADAASVSINQGSEHIVGMRLSPKGTHRWYAGCCNTPLGNSLDRAMPFIGGLPIQLFARADFAGPPRATFSGTAPDIPKLGHVAKLHYLFMILGWNRGGKRWKTWPNPFFETATRAAKFEIAKTLSPDERKTLGLLVSLEQ